MGAKEYSKIDNLALGVPLGLWDTLASIVFLLWYQLEINSSSPVGIRTFALLMLADGERLPFPETLRGDQFAGTAATLPASRFTGTQAFLSHFVSGGFNSTAISGRVDRSREVRSGFRRSVFSAPLLSLSRGFPPRPTQSQTAFSDLARNIFAKSARSSEQPLRLSVGDFQRY